VKIVKIVIFFSVFFSSEGETNPVGKIAKKQSEGVRVC